jgi:hypothetical protein
VRWLRARGRRAWRRGDGRRGDGGLWGRKGFGGGSVVMGRAHDLCRGRAIRRSNWGPVTGPALGEGHDDRPSPETTLSTSPSHLGRLRALLGARAARGAREDSRRAFAAAGAEELRSTPPKERRGRVLGTSGGRMASRAVKRVNARRQSKSPARSGLVRRRTFTRSSRSCSKSAACSARSLADRARPSRSAPPRPPAASSTRPHCSGRIVR